MISPEQNELMTRIGPGTPAGKLLRRYWQPVALVDELQGPRPVKPVRLLGEDLVLFREKGNYGLLDRHCPHRGADLAYGRLEDGGYELPEDDPACMVKRDGTTVLNSTRTYPVTGAQSLIVLPVTARLA